MAAYDISALWKRASEFKHDLGITYAEVHEDMKKDLKGAFNAMTEIEETLSRCATGIVKEVVVEAIPAKASRRPEHYPPLGAPTATKVAAKLIRHRTKKKK